MSGASGSLRDQQDRPRTAQFHDGRYRRPATQLVERDGESVLRVELPGLDREDIDLRMDEEAGTLRVTGDPEEGATYFRRIPLPAEVDPEDVAASFETGVLEVTLPVSLDAMTPGRSIEVGGEPADRLDRIRREIDDLEAEVADRLEGGTETAAEMFEGLRERVDDLADSVRGAG